VSPVPCACVTRLLRLTAWVTASLLAVVSALGVAGFYLFVRPHVDPLQQADAIVVLGGDWDGRVAYGLNLARQGYADTVVLSTGYEGRATEMKAACAAGTAKVTVQCFTPDPWTTLGEAMFTARLAAEQHWTKLIVVSWNYHMVRARYIFGQCYHDELVMHPVPREYRYSVIRWASVFTYQYAAMVKAFILGCRT
jgi:uncharacterized SAM-binding protein YcdF (DUF218 family)